MLGKLKYIRGLINDFDRGFSMEESENSDAIGSNNNSSKTGVSTTDLRYWHKLKCPSIVINNNINNNNYYNYYYKKNYYYYYCYYYNYLYYNIVIPVVKTIVYVIADMHFKKTIYYLIQLKCDYYYYYNYYYYLLLRG